MNRWSLHWLEAEGSLDRWKTELTEQVRSAERAVEHVLKPPRIDILIAHRSPDSVIPELGLCGFTYSPSMFLLACHPENPNFATSLTDGAGERQVIHEMHHCLRKAGPGYGRTLGEALVSEGLAGRFVEHVLGTPPELWEQAVGATELSAQRPDANLLRSADYDHAEWFFGTKSLPRWLGYTLGYQIVGQWLRNVPPPNEDVWKNVSAETVLSTAGLLDH